MTNHHFAIKKIQASLVPIKNRSNQADHEWLECGGIMGNYDLKKDPSSEYVFGTRVKFDRRKEER